MNASTDGERAHVPIEDVLEPVFRRMGAPPMIVVMPDGNAKYGCGQWVDSPVSGSFASYVAKDVLSHVDANFRTIPDARSRGVFGFSSAGMGAWNIVSQHPDVFTAMTRAVGRHVPGHDPQGLHLQVLRQHLARSAGRPRRG